MLKEMFLNIDSDPKEEEECAKAHEEAGHPGDHQLLSQLSSELGRGHLVRIFFGNSSSLTYVVPNLIDEEPGGEEEANAEEDEGEVREHGGVDWGDVAGEGVQGGHGHLDVCKFESSIVFHEEMLKLSQSRITDAITTIKVGSQFNF